MFDWNRAFTNHMADIFTKTIQNILSNFIPHQTITINDKDPPNLGKDYNNTQLNNETGTYANHPNNSIDSSNYNYYLRVANKLSSIQESSKAYFLLFKSFFSNERIPITLPILYNNALVTDFKKKAQLFNSYFANQCTLIKSNSTLPLNVQYLTDMRLSLFNFSEDEIMKVN